MRPFTPKDLEACMQVAKAYCRRRNTHKRYLCVKQTFSVDEEGAHSAMFRSFYLDKGKICEIQDYVKGPLIDCHWVRSTHKVQPGEIVFVIETSINAKITTKEWSSVQLEEKDIADINKLRFDLRHKNKEFLSLKEIDSADENFIRVKAHEFAINNNIEPATIVKLKN